MIKKQGTQKWAIVDDVIIVLSTDGPTPTGEIWDNYIKDLKTRPIKKYLGISVGSPEPTSVQRKQASEVLKSRKISCAIVTDERFVRGIVTAVSWLGVDIKAFPWTEMRAAIRHLGVSRMEEERVYEEAIRLKESV